MKNYKYIYAIIFLVLMSQTPSFSQGNWEVQNPLPTESYLLTVEPVTDDKIFIGGLGGTLLKSEDSGNTWIVQKFKDLVNIRSISFKDTIHGWLVDSKHLYKSNDCGENWDKILTEIDTLTYVIHDIFCLDNTIYLILPPLSAYAGDEEYVSSLIIKSMDGGITWKPLEQEIKGKIRCEFFLTDSIGFLGVSQVNSYFYKTIDGGKTWILSFFPGYLGPTPGIFFLDENFGFVGQYKTIDGGLSWENIFIDILSEYESVDNIFFTDSLHGWAITGAMILQTSDGGLSWQEANQRSTHQLTDINFSPNGTGWVVGWAGNIYRKKTGTDTWESLSTGPRNIFKDVYFVDNNNGWCVGDKGSIFKTSNGGETWVKQSCPVDSTLLKVKFLNKFNGWIAGYGIVLHTTDGGQNWQLVNDLHGWFTDMDFFDDKNGLLLEYSGAVFRTADGGVTWQLVNDEPLLERLTCIAIIDENEAWIGGYGGLGHTTDKGLTIQWYDIPGLLQVSEIQFVDKNTGFLCNDYGDFLGTTDGGWTWQEFPRGTGLHDEVDEFYALCADTVWLYLGPGGMTLKKIAVDETIKVTETSSYSFVSINSLFFINKNMGWAVGEGGIILKYTDNSGLPVTVIKNHLLIYPNPFGRSYMLTMVFTLQQAQKIDVTIYNSIGQRVQTLFTGFVNEGDQKFHWQPDNIPSGFYVISVSGDNIELSQKCLLIK